MFNRSWHAATRSSICPRVSARGTNLEHSFRFFKSPPKIRRTTFFGMPNVSAINRDVTFRSSLIILSTAANFLFWTLSSVHNFFTNTSFWKPALFSTSDKEAPNLVGPLEQASFSRWANTEENSTCEDMCLRTNQSITSDNEIAIDNTKTTTSIKTQTPKHPTK